jgi:hypothetical protein
VGDYGEAYIQSHLESHGYTDFVVVKNNSGHGIDIVGKAPNRELHMFEVKTTRGPKPLRLSKLQAQGGPSYSKMQLGKAAGDDGVWAERNRPTGAISRRQASELLEWIGDNPDLVRHFKADVRVSGSGDDPLTQATIGEW